MTDTIRELINRVLDYVEKMPGAYFEIARWDEGIKKPNYNQMYFTFYYTMGDDSVHYISHNGDEYWSQLAVLDKYNLRYLLSRLEGEER